MHDFRAMLWKLKKKPSFQLLMSKIFYPKKDILGKKTSTMPVRCNQLYPID